MIAVTEETDSLENGKIKYIELELHDKSTDKVETIKAKDFNLKDKKIFLLFITKIGKITFNGQFLGKHGPAFENVDDNQKIMVLNGTFSINGKCEKQTKFTFFGGD